MKNFNALKKLHESLLKFEEALEANLLTEAQVLEISAQLEKLKDSSNKSLKMLSLKSSSIQKDMGLREFMTIMVPVERELNKKVTDEVMGVKTKDLEVKVKTNELIVVLDNVRSSFNVGSLFRTCDALGVKEVVITGYTEGLESERVRKTAMGAEPKVVKLRDLEAVKKKLSDYQMVALETSQKSQSIFETKLFKKTAFVIGNEKFGLSEYDLSLCDTVVELPVFGLKNSLNVNAALSASGYEWVRQQL